MFMGTLTIKGPKTSTAMGMSLEEMDRPVSFIMMIVMMMILDDDNKDDNDSFVGALSRKHRPVLMGGDVQAEEGEDQNGGGPAQPCQGGCRGRGGSFFSFYFCNSLIR